ncbi:MAG: hypothetical protein QW360_03200 [Thermofilum sp.]
MLAMAEELQELAKSLVVGLRQAEELAKQGKIEDAKKLYRELRKQAVEKKLYRGLIGLFRKVERLIEG